jgi:hypothetical protein
VSWNISGDGGGNIERNEFGVTSEISSMVILVLRVFRKCYLPNEALTSYISTIDPHNTDRFEIQQESRKNNLLVFFM